MKTLSSGIRMTFNFWGSANAIANYYGESKDYELSVEVEDPCNSPPR